MSPGRLSEPSILASVDWGYQTTARSSVRGHCNGQSETNAVRNVSAVDITSRRAPGVLNHVNCAPVFVGLNHQNHFVVSIFFVVIQVLNRAIKLQAELSPFQPCFRQEMPSMLLMKDQLRSFLAPACCGANAYRQFINPTAFALNRQHANSGSRIVKCFEPISPRSKAACANYEAERYVDYKTYRGGWRNRRASFVRPQSK